MMSLETGRVWANTSREEGPLEIDQILHKL